MDIKSHKREAFILADECHLRKLGGVLLIGGSAWYCGTDADAICKRERFWLLMLRRYKEKSKNGKVDFGIVIMRTFPILCLHFIPGNDIGIGS